MKNLVMLVVFALCAYWFVNAIGNAIDKEIAFTDERVAIHLAETKEVIE